MRVFINALKGVYRNAQYSLTEDGFNQLGIEPILFFSNEEVVGMERGDILISTKRRVEARLAELGGVPEILTLPDELLPFASSSLRRRDARDITIDDMPVFTRAVKGAPFTSAVLRDPIDLQLNGVKGDVWLCDVEHFESTWRCFVRYGTVLSIEACEGNPLFEPDYDLIREAAAAWTSAPAGGAIDFGVTLDGRTLLLTTRDGWCLDPCGLDGRSYALLLAARWAQIVGVEDEFADVV